MRALVVKTRLKPNDVTEALLETLEFLPDIAIDSPKAVNHANLQCLNPNDLNVLQTNLICLRCLSFLLLF